MKYLKMAVWFLLVPILIIGLAGTIFLLVSPEFGKSPGPQRKKEYRSSSNYSDGRFHNETKTDMNMNSSKVLSILRDYAYGIPRQKPKEELPILKVSSTNINSNEPPNAIIWFGHSAFLLKLNGKIILIDPMFGDSPSPVPFFGAERFSEGLPIEISQLPVIDYVLLSHDHYDHLDYGSIKKLLPKTRNFLVPLGVGSHLESWGVDTSSIREFDWWQNKVSGKFKFTCTPARHFSGRGIANRFSTLWSSWTIESDSLNLFFSGDSGYGPHFKEIGERLGPFDFAMIECGQYDERWKDIHMLPEQTATAAKDLGATTFMPIHWGSFVLALHSWDDPVIRVSKKARELDQSIIVPKIGEIIELADISTDYEGWWKEKD